MKIFFALWAFAVLYYMARGIEVCLWQALLLLDAPVVYSTELHITLICVAVVAAVAVMSLIRLFGGKQK